MLTAFLFLFIHPAHAQTAGLKQQALQEIEQHHPAHPAPAAASETKALTGILRLEDPRSKIKPRKWDYFVGVTAESFRPHGTLTNDFSSTGFELDSAGRSVLPSLQLGFQAPLADTARWGVFAKGSYLSQKESVTFSTGYKENDVRLNTTIVSLNPFLSINPFGLDHWSLDLGLEWGVLDYSQSSSDELANVNSHSVYWGWTMGAEFKLIDGLRLIAAYSNRGLIGHHDNIALQKDALSLGTRLLW